MRKSINKILQTAGNLNISHLQALYLWGVREQLTIEISALELKTLVEKDLLKGNNLSAKGIQALMDAEKSIDNPVYVDESLPILTSETAQIVKRLSNHFMKNKLTIKEFDRIAEYAGKEIQVPFIFIFLQMFPTSNAKENADWNTHFETIWDNVTLRKMTTGTIKKFQAVWKKKDIGIFLLGTYLFIKGSYNEQSAKYYIKSLENYFLEWEHWYNEAQNTLDSGKLEFIEKKVQTSNTYLI